MITGCLQNADKPEGKPRAHVGRQVRVEGELDAAAANTAGPQRIRVVAVERVADTCAQR
jgi:hypothetical protein